MLDTNRCVLMVKNPIRPQRNAEEKVSLITCMCPVGWLCSVRVILVQLHHGPSSRLLPGDEQDVLCVIQDTPLSVYTGFEKNISHLFKLTSLHGYHLVDLFFFFLILEPLPHSGQSFRRAQPVSPPILRRLTPV